MNNKVGMTYNRRNIFLSTYLEMDVLKLMA
jgi:hypothetical protein